VIVIIGAGLAGLTCAKVLLAAGKDVVVVDASDAPGGRVRTDTVDGFTLDRGFQVLFTAYPAVRKHIDLAALQLRAFQPGAAIAKQGKLYGITDPFRDRNFGHVVETVANPLISFGDKLRVAALRADANKRCLEDIFNGLGDQSTFEDLVNRGFDTAGFIDQFIRPFYGGIFLNRDLHTSARMFLFTFKMLAAGDTVLPAQGIQALANQLAGRLSPAQLRFNSPVQSLQIADGQVTGVVFADGTVLAAESVVVATDLLTMQRLTRIELPAAIAPVPVTCVYFASPTSLYEGAKIVLNPATDAVVNNTVQLSNIVPEYAPAGQHLLSATVLGAPTTDDDTLFEQVRADIGRIFPATDTKTLRPLRIYRIPLAQFDQPAGIFAKLPKNLTDIRQLLIAGDYTESSSIHGAMHSGEKAAAILLGQRN